MRSLVIMIILILVYSSSFAFNWDDDGYWAITYSFDKANLTRQYIYFPLISENLQERFTQIPQNIIWENVDDPLPYTFEVRYLRNMSNWWKSGGPPATLKGKDLQPFLYWKFNKLLGDSVIYTPCTSGDKNVLISFNEGNAFQGVKFDLVEDIRNIPIPQDSAIWEFSLELWETPPPGGKMLSQTSKGGNNFLPNVVRAHFIDSIDTLTYFFFNDKLDKNICKYLEKQFPKEEIVIRQLFNISYKNGDKDGLKNYGTKLYNIWSEDPTYWRKATLSFSAQLANDYINGAPNGADLLEQMKIMIDEICEEGN